MTKSPTTTAAFLERAWRFHAGHGITIERILTDNGGCYRSRDLAAAVTSSGSAIAGHGRTGRRPTARPNGSSAHC